MGFRDDLQRRIAKKQQEVAALKTQVALEERYLQAMQDMFKLAPRDVVTAENGGPDALRKGSSTHKAYVVLKREGHTIHVKQLVELIGKKPTRSNYSSLSSSLNTYARKGEIFTKPEPNTFGLIEFGTDGLSAAAMPTGFNPDAED